MNEPMRVVIAEDNYLLREGTRRLLEDSGEVDVLAGVGSADELILAVDRLRPNAVVTDIRMPPGKYYRLQIVLTACKRDHALRDRAAPTTATGGSMGALSAPTAA